MVPVASSVTVAGTFAAAPAARRVKVVGMIEAAFMGLLNVAVTVVLGGTPVALGAGDSAITASAETGRTPRRESVQSAVAAASLKKKATVAVYMVPVASGVEGVGGAMVPEVSGVPVAGILVAAPAARRVKVVVVIVAAFTALLNVAVTVVLRATPVAPGAGDSAITASDVGVKLHTEFAPSGVPATAVTLATTVAV